MTSRCDDHLKRRMGMPLLATLLMLSAAWAGSAVAQQDSGADVPPPPKVKPATVDQEDQEFRSPLRGQGFREMSDDRPAFGGGAHQKRMRGMGAEGGAPFGGRRGGMRGGPMGGGIAQQLDLSSLNLTEEQKQRVRDIRQSTRERAKSTRGALMEKQIALRKLIFSPDATDGEIRTARKEVRKVQDQMEDLSMEDLLKIRNVLTPEQKAKLPDIAPRGPGGGERFRAARRGQ